MKKIGRRGRGGMESKGEGGGEEREEGGGRMREGRGAGGGGYRGVFVCQIT